MARLPRFDQPGRWFHVMNRGLARRTVFETERDIRYFLSRIAYAVRRGEVEVHVFCVMTTHYHLLVRSPTGQLSEAMRRIQNEYVRYFNRLRGRDGPLFRGRFLSKPVLSLTYRRILVAYIDQNPVQAGVATTPWAYRHGSAARHMSGRPPRWLCTEWLGSRQHASRHADYAAVWGAAPTDVERELVKTRLAGRGLPDDPLDDLVHTAPARVRAWMVKSASLADGTQPGLACVPPSLVVDVVGRLREEGRSWRHATATGQQREVWGTALVGLLRSLAGQTHRDMGERLGISTTMAARRVRMHAELCQSAAYATRLGRVATLCLRTAFPSRGQRV